MSGRWFRFYDAALDDPKVQQLPPKVFKAWVNLLCVASRNNGEIPAIEVIAFALRISSAEAGDTFSHLFNVGLLDRDSDGRVTPHNWDGRQYKSDTSSDRMRRHRERRRDVTSAVTVTRSESEADTDTETDSVPNGTGADAPQDPVKELFDSGVKLLTENGCREGNARSIIGKWRSEHGDEATQAAIKAARVEGITEPISWITQRFAGKSRETWRERQVREAEAAIDKALQ